MLEGGARTVFGWAISVDIYLRYAVWQVVIVEKGQLRKLLV
jgi:hypothetical protein